MSVRSVSAYTDTRAKHPCLHTLIRGTTTHFVNILYKTKRFRKLVIHFGHAIDVRYPERNILNQGC